MKRRVAALLFVLCTGISFGFFTGWDYRLLHFNAVVADTHNDVLQRAMNGEDLSLRTTKGHSDLERMKEGGVDIEMFSIWAPPDKIPHSYEYANAMIDSLESLVRRNSDKVGMALNTKQVHALVQDGKIAALMGMEGAHPIEDSVFDEEIELQKLDHFYTRGIRYMTLTWNNSVRWATSAKDETDTAMQISQKGLTTFGEKIVRRMNKLGMMIDVSHVGEKTFADVMRVSTKPVIASHSSVYNICPHRRNLKNEQIQAIAKSGGVVFINFFSGFLDSTYLRKEKILRERHQKEIDSLKAQEGEHWSEHEHTIVAQHQQEFEAIRPPLSLLIDHIDYVAKLVGTDHVGLGSDFDGVGSLPKEMDDVTFLPNITRELLVRGYSENDIRKILGGNFLRVFKQVCG